MIPKTEAVCVAHLLARTRAVRLVVSGSLLLTASCLPRDKEVGRTRTDTKLPASERSASPKRTPPAPRPSSAASSVKPASNSELTAPDPILTGEFSDGFNDATLASHWHATSGAWRVEDGRLCVSNARNHPVWLARRLPTNARIEFDATSYSPDGDLKAEYWGDGRSFATQASYTRATSYLTIFGGWKNQFHVLARVDEHAANRPERVVDPQSKELPFQPVAAERTYRFKVEREDGKTVIWWVDGVEILRYADDAPLLGPGHEHFGFNNWEVRTCFDNLHVLPLDKQ